MLTMTRVPVVVIKVFCFVDGTEKSTWRVRLVGGIRWSGVNQTHEIFLFFQENLWRVGEL